ncbi:MAG: hypothetical protein JW795_07405 [Chitinivibrionales bacterium]|nr:hypothetical protein [Chitinivibrionales bacterium]
MAEKALQENGRWAELVVAQQVSASKEMQSIFWNGSDSEGKEVSNGLYLLTLTPHDLGKTYAYRFFWLR